MTFKSAKSDPRANSPFALDNAGAYRRWRDAKLSARPGSAGDLVVEVADPLDVTAAEHDALLRCLRSANMAVYICRRTPADPKDAVRAMARLFGLERLDLHLCAEDEGITPLQVTKEGPRRRYIPYTDRPINWHTDGYYNAPDKQIRAFLLHCAGQSKSGGENMLMDPEIAYIRLRDRDPGLVAALYHAEAMSIPPNEEDGTDIRAAVTGPVFSVHSGDGTLGMRYTARTRSISWRGDPATHAAVEALGEILAAPDGDIFRRRLAPGQGLITNNVLHGRAAFTDSGADGEHRVVYRARYYDRAQGTALHEA